MLMYNQKLKKLRLNSKSLPLFYDMPVFVLIK
jgi:hypothetical protein